MGFLQGFCLSVMTMTMTTTMLTSAKAKTVLQILHSSDNESSFQDPNTLEEKVIYYSALVRGLQMQAMQEGIPSIHLTVGDHTLPGPFYGASAQVDELGNFAGLADIAMFNAYPNVANGLGNHEFDGGISDIARMINAANYPFLSVNLDLSQAQLEPGTPPIEIAPTTDDNVVPPCQDIAGQVAKSCYLTVNDGNTTTLIGLIGRSPNDFFQIVETTAVPGVDFVGGRNPEDNTPLLSAVPMVLEQVDLLQAQGVDIIILLDHAQDFTDDPLEAAALRGIDIIIQAGATGFLAGTPMGPYNFLRPEDEAGGDYPTVLMDSENKTVLSIDSDELYFYIGQLLVTFDDEGNVESWDARSGPIATTAEAVDLLTIELGLNTTLEPIPAVRETLDLLQSTPSIQQAFQVIGNTTTALNGVRASVRTRETNLGRVVADSTLWAANEYSAANGLPVIDIAFKNGGGIRDQISGPTIIRLTVEAALAFDNTLALVELNVTQLLAAVENGVSRVPEADGRFCQVAGLMLAYNPDMPGVDSQESMDTPSRVKTLMVMKNGTMVSVVEDYMLVADMNMTFAVATNSFLLTGGDGYFSFSAGDVLGETEDGEQDILVDYIMDVLGGTVDVMDPPPNPRVAPVGVETMMPTMMPAIMPVTEMPMGDGGAPGPEPGPEPSNTVEPTPGSTAFTKTIVESFVFALAGFISLCVV